MKSGIVKERIWAAVIEKCQEHGFLFNKKTKWLERKIIGGIQIFDLLFYNYTEEILINPVFRIKLDLIEDIYHRITQKEKTYNYATVTLGNSLGQIMKYFDDRDEQGTGEQISYVVKNDKDIQLLQEIIPEKFEKYILPYFDAYSSIEQVDKLLNQKPREMSIHHYLYPKRACIGLIAAKLMNRPDYHQLVRVYEEEMTEAAPVFKKEFEDLVKLLDTM